MNQQETLDLFAKGRDDWNAWAKERLAERKALEDTGADFSEPWTLGDDATAWQKAAKADFSGHAFEDHTSFLGFHFPGDADFREAAFSGTANFQQAAFSGSADFREAAFSGTANFQQAAFSGYADFEKAAFSGYAGFREAAFSGSADFREAAFSGYALFWEAAFSGTANFQQAAFSGDAVFNATEFEGAATFTAIKASSIFSMVGTRFHAVPEFAHADFKPEAPRLDTLEIGPRGFWKPIMRFVKGDSKANPEGPGRWRVLQKLANDGHDHISEQRFFRGELLAKRGLEQQWWRAPPTYLASLIYQMTSNFGGSLILPLLWWGAGVLGFAWFYLTEHMARLGGPEAALDGATWRALRRFWETGEGFACIAGDGNPVLAALGLSASKSLFAGFGPARTLDQIHACLYGIHPRSTYESFQPVIPGWVTGVGVGQFLLSAIQIFLFGLALRNHFKIK